MKLYTIFLMLFFLFFINLSFSQENIIKDSLKKVNSLSVLTLPPTVSSKSITFLGVYMNKYLDSNLTTTWFEYSDDQKMLEKGNGLVVGKIQGHDKSVDSFTYTLTEPLIQKGFTYYLRAVAESPSAGKIYGYITSIKPYGNTPSIVSVTATNITQFPQY